MTFVVDINVLLDVFQQRQPHVAASAAFLNLVIGGSHLGIVPAHGISTLYYLVRKYGTRQDAEAAVDQVLASLKVGNLEQQGWQRARQLAMPDFEDAVVAALAEECLADYIVTRNESDVRASPVRAISPASLLSLLPPPV
jgi:predicted nucleic acid-binding protein